MTTHFDTRTGSAGQLKASAAWMRVAAPVLLAVALGAEANRKSLVERWRS